MNEAFYRLFPGFFTSRTARKPAPVGFFPFFHYLRVGGVCPTHIYKKHTHTLGKKEIRSQTRASIGFAAWEISWKKGRKKGKKGTAMEIREIEKNMLHKQLLAHLNDRFDEAAKTNYCPPCGADISGRKKQGATYTAAVAQPTNRGLGFSVDVWRVCESCAIKIMTGEHKDLIVRDSIGAVVISNAEPK